MVPPYAGRSNLEEKRRNGKKEERGQEVNSFSHGWLKAICAWQSTTPPLVLEPTFLARGLENICECSRHISMDGYIFLNNMHIMRAKAVKTNAKMYLSSVS